MNNKLLADIIFPDVSSDISYYENKYPERQLNDGAIVTRFAPSPTGFVHMGSLLTAFIAKKVTTDTNGIFYLRIEDTDQKRSVLNGIEGIISDLNNFNITIDEGMVSDTKSLGKYGPYIQSKRLNIYHTYAKYMIENDMAYPCFCTSEELDLMRTSQEKNKERIGYYGNYAKYRNLPTEEAITRINNKESYVIRMKSPGDFNKKIVLNDLVRGKIEFPENDIDVVIIKSDGLPPYHFAHVIDDHLMRTTHILRGEEWLSSTPIHLQLFRMLGFKVPKFAHLGLLMKIDETGSKRKLSKRKDPEAAVSYYHNQGIPLEAVKLYLMTIANSNFEAWMDSNKEKSINEFKFDFKKMSISGSLFDIEKLLNISRNYISRLSADDLYNQLITYVKEFDNEFYKLISKYKKYTTSVLNIERREKKPRKDYAKYSDIKDNIWYMYDELFTLTDIQIKPFYNKKILLDYINNYYDITNDKDMWYNKVKELSSKYNFACEVKEYKNNPNNYVGHVGDICEMIRVSLTTKTMTPDLYEIMKVLGNEKIKFRINIFCNYLDTLK